MKSHATRAAYSACIGCKNFAHLIAFAASYYSPVSVGRMCLTFFFPLRHICINNLLKICFYICFKLCLSTLQLVAQIPFEAHPHMHIMHEPCVCVYIYVNFCKCKPLNYSVADILAYFALNSLKCECAQTSSICIQLNANERAQIYGATRV